MKGVGGEEWWRVWPVEGKLQMRCKSKTMRDKHPKLNNKLSCDHLQRAACNPRALCSCPALFGVLGERPQ